MKTFFTTFLMLFSLAWHTVADANADFDAANKLYNQGNYAAAASTYDQIIKSGSTGTTLYFNLGNAYFKSGQFGRAIVAYRQAEKLSPRDPDVKANLPFARNQISGNDSIRTNVWQRAFGRLTLNEWTVLAALAAWVWFALLALREWKPALQNSLRNLILCAGLLTFVLAGCTGADLLANHAAKSAVVIIKDASTKTGPLDDSQNAFPVHDGLELRVLDEHDEWLQVTDRNNRIGWLKRDAVQVL